MTRHVLVTGGAGFIGSHVVDACLARGWRVSVIDNLATGERANVDPRASFYEADLRDPATSALIAQLRPDVVDHQAAQVNVRKSVEDPATDTEINVVATVRLLHACHEAGVKQFVVASSGGAIYGEPVFVPQTEEHPLRPMSPYGIAKLALEHYTRYSDEVLGMRTVALRYANVYGPRQSVKGEAGVIALFADRLAAGEPVTINGTGEQTRDFVYVGDVVAANIAAIERDDLRGVFNVGTGIETTVNELYAAMCAILGITRPPQHAPAKTGEQFRSVVDASRLRKLAGLPEPVRLAEGLRVTIESFRHA